MNLLAVYMEDLPPLLMSSTLQDAHIGLKKVISVYSSDLVKTAIETMATHRLHAVAVISDGGKLLTNISTSDIVLALSNGFNINTSVHHLVSTVRRQYLFNTRGSKSFPAAVTAHATNSLRSIILKLAATTLHRLYVVDGEDFPIGVVSLIDIIKALK